MRFVYVAGKAVDAEALADRFWAKVSRGDGCWMWMASRDRKGYGQIEVMGKPARAHRISYLLTVGEITNGLFVCHHCDVRACVRPDHLFLGTNQDNMRDCANKGRNGTTLHPDRHPRGVAHPMAKLTQAKAEEIRTLHRGGGHTLDTLAARFGVSRSTIDHVVHNLIWRS